MSKTSVQQQPATTAAARTETPEGAKPNRGPQDGRSARKHRAIMDAATTLFLRNGYQGTTMDEIAALAAVSKQTVYKHFADKERLFTEIVLGPLDRVAGPFSADIAALPDTNDLPNDLAQLARRYIAMVMRPEVLQVRRIVIAEANRMPDLARMYYQGAPERTFSALATCFSQLAGKGLLQISDPSIAAVHFAYLVLGRALDQAMFCAAQEPFTPAQLSSFADAGSAAFLAAYSPIASRHRARPTGSSAVPARHGEADDEAVR